MTQPLRLPRGGMIDREQPLRFAFNGRPLGGYAGDTLASALLANGVRGVARSLKYHRLRGVFAAGPDEPNALVRVAAAARVIPNQPATSVELYEGLEAHSLNCWPSVGLDVGRVNDVFSAFLPAGFYYKTFMWPHWGWTLYERVIRRAAGLARTPAAPDIDRYTKRNAAVDVLVIGGGCAGLAAAWTAGHAGARVLLVERDADAGGQLRWRGELAFTGAAAWLDRTRSSLAGLPNVEVLTRTTAIGCYDDNLVTLSERITDHLAEPPQGLPRERLWKVRARYIVLAAGAFERLLVFPGNDLPGVMLASAAQRYVGQFAAAPGRRAVVYTNNDSGYEAVRTLLAAGVGVAAVVDSRPEGAPCTTTRSQGVRVEAASIVAAAVGGRGVQGVQVRPREGGSVRRADRRIVCDCVLLAGGWDPAVHLHSQAGGQLEFDEEQHCFLPGAVAQPMCSAGAARGVLDTEDCITDGLAAGAEAARTLGFAVQDGMVRPSRRPLVVDIKLPSSAKERSKSFVDLQSDVTVADLRLAVREGFSVSEHAKRYTTLGMGIDQGKVGNIAALGILAAETGRTVPQLGPTTFRPPFAPVTFGALAGPEIGPLFDPVRQTPIGDWHERAGAALEPVGLWRRPSFYLRPGEDARAAVAREARAVRERVGLLDASTLGKIEIVGPDAITLLDRVYTNNWRNLAIGQCRYGLMLRDNGVVFDDGVSARLGEQRYLMSTTSGNARAVEDWLEEWLQCEWRELEAHVIPVTAQWATLSVAGPRARDLLTGIDSDIDFSSGAFPHLAVRCGRFAGVAARILRVSYTGELSYEVNVPARFGRALWELLLERGARYGIEPVGLEAIDALRIDKGYIAIGHDTDGTVTPTDLGMDWIIARKKGDFLGRRGLECADALRSGRKQLVGVLTADPAIVPREGSPIVAWAHAARIDRPPVPMIGHVTSSAASVAIGRSVALALVADGRARLGERVAVVDRGDLVEAVLTTPRFYDPEGSRLRV